MELTNPHSLPRPRGLGSKDRGKAATQERAQEQAAEALPPRREEPKRASPMKLSWALPEGRTQ